MKLAVSNGADKLYNAGMSMLKSTKRRIRCKLKYHRPKIIVSRYKRKLRRYYRLPMMFLISAILAFTAETAENSALISKYQHDSHPKEKTINTCFDTYSFTIGIDSHAFTLHLSFQSTFQSLETLERGITNCHWINANSRHRYFSVGNHRQRWTTTRVTHRELSIRANDQQMPSFATTLCEGMQDYRHG